MNIQNFSRCLLPCLLIGPLTILSTGCAKKPFLSHSKTQEQAYEECHRLTVSKDYEKSNECFEVLKSRFGTSAAGFEADLEIGAPRPPFLARERSSLRPAGNLGESQRDSKTQPSVAESARLPWETGPGWIPTPTGEWRLVSA